MTELLTINNTAGEAVPVQTRSWWRIILVHLVVYICAALLLQSLSGIYRSELGHYPDEPSHLTTALMIRDYLVSGFQSSPRDYAENYYLHYPKVALGMWPPFFHLVAAGWMLLAKPRQDSLLIFMALQSAFLGTLTALFARRFMRPNVAFGVGLLLICLPLVQASTSTFMVDLFLSIEELCAMLLMIEYFRTRSIRFAVAFGICTGLAMSTKGNANSLVVMALLMIVLTRSFWAFKQRATYLSLLIIALMGLPWQIVSMHMIQGTMPMARVTVLRVWTLFSGYSEILIRVLGLPIVCLSIIGLAAAALWLFRAEQSNLSRKLNLAAATSFLLAVLLFHCITPVPGPDERYMVPVLGLFLIFAVLGIQTIAAIPFFPKLHCDLKAQILGALTLIFFTVNVFAIPQRPVLGFARAAQELSESPHNHVVLICSDADGEGALITSLALHEARPEHIVLRGSKVLSHNPWFLTQYHPFFSSPAELERFLEKVGVAAVVIDRAHTFWKEDRTLLSGTMTEYKDRWRLLPQISGPPYANVIDVYEWVGPPINPRSLDSLKIDMGTTLGRDLQLKR